MFSSISQIGRGQWICYQDCSICSGAGGDATGVTARCEQFLDCRSLSFCTSDQRPCQSAWGKCCIYMKDDIDGSWFCWFRDTGFFMPGSRITYSAGIDTDATGNNGGYMVVMETLCMLAAVASPVQCFGSSPKSSNARSLICSS